MQINKLRKKITMEDKINDLLNEGLLEQTKNKGYQERIYTLYELRTSANNYSSKAPEEIRKFIKDKYANIYNYPGEKIPVKLI